VTLAARLGLAGVRRADVASVVVLVVTCLFCAALTIRFDAAGIGALRAGMVAPRTLTASSSFQYFDDTEADAERGRAASEAGAVFLLRGDLVGELEDWVSRAFAVGRTALQDRPADKSGQPAPLPPEARAALADRFRSELGVHVPDEEVGALIDAGFSSDLEALARDLLSTAMAAPVVQDREELPPEGTPIAILVTHGDAVDPQVINDRGVVVTPQQARQQITLGLVETHRDRTPAVDAAAGVARALVRPNMSYDAQRTEARRAERAASVGTPLVTVKKGERIFTAGEVLDDADIRRYDAFRESRGERGPIAQLLAVALFLMLTVGALVHFGATHFRSFSRTTRSVGAAAALLVLTAAAARFIVASSSGIAELLGADLQPASVWFGVPVAGGAMLVRLLLGTGWTVVFAVAASAVCGLVMDLSALHVVFFLVASTAAASAVEHTRERMAVVRAGLFAGLVAAAAALTLHPVQLLLAEGVLGNAAAMRPVWSMAFAFAGGVASAAVVLALLPLFEVVGFVTDFRLMELANLNHPLLRQLMLRAPGSYHHSVIVGSLAEAAAESIGANALQARVASYFHDIGKALKPQYFVENQQGGKSRHDALDPRASARILIAHVVDGGRLAREHKLPKPIVDNIYMHHGSGLLQFFYRQALTDAEDPSQVDEAEFRYPGPKPNTREAGIIMLADKVEAATRTLKVPNEANLRAMIARIVNSVMADAQFSECPLTFREIHTVADTFVRVLMGIYHQRIEYPDTAEVSRRGHEGAPPVVPPSAVITLELDPELKPASAGQGRQGSSTTLDEEGEDYESVEYLPRGEP
jgi:hypothetical protein